MDRPRGSGGVSTVELQVGTGKSLVNFTLTHLCNILRIYRAVQMITFSKNHNVKMEKGWCAGHVSLKPKQQPPNEK